MLPRDRPQTGSGVPASASPPCSQPLIQLVGGDGIGIFQPSPPFSVLNAAVMSDRDVKRFYCRFDRGQQVVK